MAKCWGIVFFVRCREQTKMGDCTWLRKMDRFHSVTFSQHQLTILQKPCTNNCWMTATTTTTTATRIHRQKRNIYTELLTIERISFEINHCQRTLPTQNDHLYRCNWRHAFFSLHMRSLRAQWLGFLWRILRNQQRK